MSVPGSSSGKREASVGRTASCAWPLTRDLERLSDLKARVGELPLGAGALAGSTIPVDRIVLKEMLGFQSVSPNALDVTGDRDYVAETLFVVALAATHVSRLAGELLLYASSEYGFVRLDDAYCTGSSLMPQKRNPDVFELARSKAARTVGDLVALLTTLKGLPAGYHKDLQEDKAFLFDAVDTMLLTLPAMRGAVETLQPVPDRMRAALDDGLLATDVASDPTLLAVGRSRHPQVQAPGHAGQDPSLRARNGLSRRPSRRPSASRLS